MDLATAFIKFKPQTTGFKEETVKEARDAGTAAGTEGGKTLKKSFDQNAQGVGVQAFQGLKNVFVGTAIVGGIKNVIDKASDLNETITKSQTIFGEAAGEIEDFGTNAAKSLGQSKQGAIDAASTFATFGKAAGLAGQDLAGFAEESTTLASDLASFFNTRPEDAVQAIGAAFRGESEPIRAYGVLLDEATIKNQALKDGLITSTKDALLPSQKVLAAYHAILAQTGDAQGDFARTADGAANSQRILAAEAANAQAKLGTQLLPIYKQLLSAVSLLVEGFSALPEPIQLSVVALVAFAALRGPVGAVLNVLSGIGPAILAAHPAVIGIVAALGALAIILSDSGQILNESKGEYAGFARAVSDIKTPLRSAFSELEKAALSTDTSSKALLQLGLTVTDVQEMMSRGLVPADIIANLRAASDGSEETEKAIDQLGGTIAALQWSEFIAGASQLNGALKALGVEGIKEAAAAAGSSQQSVDALGLALGQGTVNATILSQTGINLAGTLDGVRTAMQNAKQPVDDLSGATSGYNDTSETTIEHTQTVAALFDAAAAASQRFSDALKTVFGPAQSLADAEQALYENAANLTKAFTDNGTTLDIATEKGRANRDEIEKSVVGYEDYAVALINSGASQDEATGKLNFYRNALIEQAVQSGLSRTEVEAYINQLGLTPENVNTVIAVADLAKSKGEIEDWLKNVNPVSKGGRVPDEVISAVKAALDRGSIQDALDSIHGVETNNGRGWHAVVQIETRGVEGNLAAGLSGRIDRGAVGRLITQPTFMFTGEGGPEVLLNEGQATRAMWALANGGVATTSDGRAMSVSAPLIVQGSVYGVEDLNVWADQRDRKLAFELGAR